MSAQVVGCPYCHANILLEGEHFGRMNECPECRGQFVAPPMAAVVVPPISEPPLKARVVASAPRLSSHTDQAAVQIQTTNAARRPRALGCLFISISPFIGFVVGGLLSFPEKAGIISFDTLFWSSIASVALSLAAGLIFHLLAYLRA